MRVEQLSPMTFRVTLHGVELATLIAAARSVVAGKAGELTDDARDQLQAVVAGYDRQRKPRPDRT